MENGGNIFNTTNRNRSQTGGWDIWELNSSRFGWACNSSDPTFPTAAASATCTPEATTICSAAAATYPEACASASSCSQALLFPHHTTWAYHQSPYAGDGSHYHPDPHLMCLKLGKRHYFEDTSGSGGASNPVSGSSCDRHNDVAASGGTTLIMGKRGRPGYYGGVGPATTSTAVVTTVPRCQVEGCHVALINSKDYHRRHKVCEMHSKAPNVMVLGLEQRFCQQCSRFHVVSEFDESKRSCRRRLAGHNERRRKTTHDSGSINRTSSQDKPMVDNVRFPCLSPPTARALSLLSSNYESWVSPSDISSRSSAALRELIAENRAAILARQLVLDRHQPMDTDQDLAPESCSIFSSLAPNQHQTLPDQSRCWDDRLHDTGTHITLDLMQAPSSAFGFMSSEREKNKVEDEECSNLWNTFEGSHVV